MEVTDAVMVIAAGIFAGFLNVVAGGGSLITLPLLIFLGLPSAVANATNRIAIVGQNIFAVAGFLSKGISSWPYNLYLGISACIGAVFGARIAVDIPDQLFNRILSLVMLVVAILIIIRPVRTKSAQQERLSVKHQIIGIVSFFGVGVYGGFIQAGVGFIMIPLLTAINRFSLVKTNSTKVFVALTYSLSALAVFIMEGVVNWVFGLVLALGTAIGGWIGSRWSVAKGDVWIKRVLIVTIVGLAVKLWFFN
jgi:uncharacterized membrane protein YfcA